MSEGILPDVLVPGLEIVFCGSAAGTRSAALGAYYAGPGNKFWPTLAAVGLTPQQIAPADFRSLPTYGLGLTDLCKSAFGNDAELPAGADDVASLVRKIGRYRPRILAFTAKRPASVVLRETHGLTRIALGLQVVRLGESALFVLPSSSGRAGAYWDERPWRALAALAREMRKAG
jgi:TDG/mug DNA glycosylase family protein